MLSAGYYRLEGMQIGPGVMAIVMVMVHVKVAANYYVCVCVNPNVKVYTCLFKRGQKVSWYFSLTHKKHLVNQGTLKQARLELCNLIGPNGGKRNDSFGPRPTTIPPHIKRFQNNVKSLM